MEITEKEQSFRIWPFLLFEIFIFSILFLLNFNPIYLASLLVLAVFPFIFYHPIRILLFLIAYISFLPSQTWGRRYEFFPAVVDWRILFSLFMVMFLVFIVRRGLEQKWFMGWHTIDRIILSFLVYSGLSLLWGVYRNPTPSLAIQDFYFIIFFSTYFLVRMMLREESSQKQFLVICLAIFTLTALEYLWVVLNQFSIMNIFLNRVTTRQPHLAILSIPFFLSLFLFEKKWLIKISAFILLLPQIFVVVLSQQRALWLVMLVISFYGPFFFYFMREGLHIKRFLSFFFISVVVLLGIVGVIWLVDRLVGYRIVATVLKRGITLLKLTEDPSLKIRVFETKIVLEQWKQHWLFGCGLGAVYPRLLVFGGQGVVDNSFIFILWKMGLVGLILFLLGFIGILAKSIQTYWKTRNQYNQIVLSSLIVGLAGIFLVAFTNMSLIHYRFTVVWAVWLGLLMNLSESYR